MSAEAPLCYFCGRPLGERLEWHHPVPKSRGGRETVAVHPICHRAIHRALDNKALARDYAARLGGTQGPGFPCADAAGA